LSWQDDERVRAAADLDTAILDFVAYEMMHGQGSDPIARRVLSASVRCVELGVDDSFARRLVDGELANRRIPE
jgi:hypothetical protein